jgi:glucose/arabinose dehydrogenase
MKHPSLLLAALFALALTTAHAGLPAPDPDNGGLVLPPGFRALVVADNLKPLRQLAVAPNGDLYIKTRQAGIYALRDADGDGRAEIIREFGDGGGTGIALRGEWLYHSTDDHVFRYRLAPGELVPSGEPERIVRDLLNQRQHAAKAFAFGPDGRLYVEIGAPNNALGEPDRARGAVGQDPTGPLKTYGGFWRFDPDKRDQTQSDGFHFSTGHRHVLSIALNPVSNRLFVAQHGRDQLNTVAPQHYSAADNAELPAETFHVLTEGADLGWPTTYWDGRTGQRKLNPEYGGDGRNLAEPGKFPDPLVSFPAHWAPMQLAFYTGTQFPARYRHGAFLAFHGSWNRAPEPQKGYNVVFIPFDEKGMPTGKYEVFADGFAGTAEIASPRDAKHRPNGVGVGPDGSLYISDSQAGRVWRIIYTGEKK